MMPHVSAFLVVKWGSLMGALNATGAQDVLPLGSPELTAALMQQGAHYAGHLALSQGANPDRTDLGRNRCKRH
jgi:AGZA family xanthine/uracil permease-like MFS transporter